jgi:hypothetical protein
VQFSPTIISAPEFTGKVQLCKSKSAHMGLVTRKVMFQSEENRSFMAAVKPAPDVVLQVTKAQCVL